ncbi:PE-PPE domain-containing protein [Mycolicibacterium gilvum]|uniref:PE-PPE domain-containing protein n=1 Tax=Mycolicibacterium gilvum TaxID=1804 RepID=A0A378SKM1_9MYCO|nr:PE-PPE domain-containing protein [Mycolicibacterium gilvum]MCV7057222.1 PE-PPE domain-containing protein [Mycolicibacterium gilvum]STZ42446.1 PE-PPE domain-containing protein [Mycolicibacterium gilvum]
MRKTGVVCGTVFASAALALSSSSLGQAANTALVIGGISTPSMADALMSPLLGGKFKDQQRVSVKWPAQAGPMTGKGDLTLGASIAQGATNLNAQIDAALAQLKSGEKVTVVGLSAGSLVVNEILRELDESADAPGKDKITFVVVADSSRQKVISRTRYNANLDYTYQTAPETKYDIIVVTGEYDGMADFPDRLNLLAIVNAVAGGIFVHIPVMYADLSKVPARNISVEMNSEGGTTTHYLVPAEKLPLVRLFPSLANREAELKAKIDAAYSRNDVVAVSAPKAAVFAAAPAPAAPTAVVQTPSAAQVPGSVAASLRTAKADAVVEDAAVSEEVDVKGADTADADIEYADTSDQADIDSGAEKEAAQEDSNSGAQSGDDADKDGSVSSDSGASTDRSPSKPSASSDS